MKRASAIGVAVLALTGLLLGAASPAQAATPVAIEVTADAYALDGSGQITSNSEFLFDSAKGETFDTGYQIAYRGNLDMSGLWGSYDLFKFFWGLNPGNDDAEWAKKTFSGNWDISFTVDTSVVESNPSFVDCGALQSEIEAQNPGSEIATFIRCTGVSYNDQTGEYAAQFTLINADGSKVSSHQLDTNHPSSLHLTTPAGAFFVPQSAFEAGKTFVMTNPTVTGQMKMDALTHPLMPITFDDRGNDVALTMVQTYDAAYSFESGTAGRALPAEVLGQLPPRSTMIVDGTVVTPGNPAETTVRDGQGAWTFTGWTPASATIAGADVAFVGTWDYVVDPDAQFGVSYVFVDEHGDPVPTEVAELLPPATTAVQGSTVTAADPSATTVRSANGTWTFAGWHVSSAVIDGADVEFVGEWSFEPTRVTPVVPTDPATPKPAALAASGGPGSAALAFGAVAAFLGGLTAIALGRKRIR